MQLNAGDMCRLAADLAEEHGESAREYARRAVASFESEGEPDRAKFWFMLSVFLDDIMLQRLDPQEPITIH
ncbi:MAG TPA: hypothetical protein VMF58_08800 [Rhizomicrobium sp.]|nr:hypothetical protein [Rhizomicrobium sp.]